MERKVEAAGAETKEEIRNAVTAAWQEITPDMLERISANIREYAE
jgi:hypothetical protein